MMKHTIDMYTTRGQMCDAMQKEIDNLEAQLAEAREDSERLRYVCDNEWLVTYTIDEQCDIIYFVYENEKIIGTGYSYQEAIDNSMKEVKK